STTIVLGTLSNATRVFKNGVSLKIREIENQGDVDFSQVAPLASGARTKKMWQETGDTEDAMWSCSQSIGLISDIPTCKELVGPLPQSSSRLCCTSSLPHVELDVFVSTHALPLCHMLSSTFLCPACMSATLMFVLTATTV
ncbi:unnamed protein product, partial [Symbiodinium pilosum]